MNLIKNIIDTAKPGTDDVEGAIREFLEANRPKDGRQQILQWWEVGLKAGRILDDNGVLNRADSKALGAYLQIAALRQRFRRSASSSPAQDPKTIAMMDAMSLSEEKKEVLLNLLLEFQRRVRAQIS